MGPTIETRSRDEWLAEVKRRGGRLRRRRQLTMAAVGAVAMMLPLGAWSTYLAGVPARDVRQLVAGPAPVGETGLVGGTPAPAPPNQPATGEVPQVATIPEVAPTTTVAEVHERVAGINGVPRPRSSPTSVPPADDPVVRPPVTTPAPAGSTLAAGVPASDTTVPTTLPPTGPRCAPGDVRGNVVMDKPVFASGEGVRGTSTLENRGATACVLSFDVILHVGDATGNGVDALKVADFQMPVSVEPGRTFTSPFTWDQKACTGAVITDVYPVPRERCPQVPAGTYTITEFSGQPPASASFQIGA